jgi:hypothetical protein
MGFGDKSRFERKSVKSNVGPVRSTNERKIKHTNNVLLKNGQYKGKAGEVRNYKSAYYNVYVNRECKVISAEIIKVDPLHSNINFTALASIKDGPDMLVLSNNDYYFGDVSSIGMTFDVTGKKQVDIPCADDYILVGIREDSVYIMCKKYNIVRIPVKDVVVVNKEFNVVTVTSGQYAKESTYYGEYQDAVVDILVYNKPVYGISVNNIMYMDVFLTDNSAVQVVSVNGDVFTVIDSSRNTFTVNKSDIRDFNNGFEIVNSEIEEVIPESLEFVADIDKDIEEEVGDLGDEEKEIVEFQEPDEQINTPVDETEYKNSYKDTERIGFTSSMSKEDKIYKALISKIKGIIGELNMDIFEVIGRCSDIVSYFKKEYSANDDKYTRYIVACVVFYEYIKDGIRSNRSFTLKSFTKTLEGKFLYEKDVMSQIDENVLLNVKEDYANIKNMFDENNTSGLVYTMMKNCDIIIQSKMSLHIDSDYEGISYAKPLILASGKVISMEPKLLVPRETIYSRGNAPIIVAKDRNNYKLHLNEYLTAHKYENENAKTRFYTYSKRAREEDNPVKLSVLNVNELNNINMGYSELPEEEIEIKWDRKFKLSEFIKEMETRWTLQKIDKKLSNWISENLHRGPYAIREISNNKVKQYVQNLYDELLSRFELTDEEYVKVDASSGMAYLNKVNPISKDTYAYRREQKRREAEALIESVTKKAKSKPDSRSINKSMKEMNLNDESAPKKKTTIKKIK